MTRKHKQGRERENPGAAGVRATGQSGSRGDGNKTSGRPAVEGIFWPPFDPGPAAAQVMQVQFEMSQWWEPARILSCQLAQLRNVIIHAARTTPFYRDRLKAVLAKSVRGLRLSDFRQIPILTRDEFQRAGDDMYSAAIPASHGAIYGIRTSGSTGQPLVLKGTEVTRMYNAAKDLRDHLWHRRDFSQKALAFRTLQPGKSVIRLPAWGPVVNAAESVKVSMAQPASKLLDILKAENPAYLVTHPSVLKELLYLSRERSFQPASLKEVCTLGEILYPELRERCQHDWNVRVTDNYSCQEFGSLALQCPEFPHYHVQSECALIEVLRPDNTPCQPGEVGKTVISSLHNFATPILRYENGDMAEVGEPCACGRGLPVLRRIIGRVRNTAILPNGERLMPNLSTGPLLNELPIKHFQLVQKTTELIEARLVVGRPLTTGEETALAGYFNTGWRHEFKFAFVYVDAIPRGKNGKYEVFLCEVPRA